MKEIKSCRCCGLDNLHSYLDLGDQPLANAYHNGERLEEFPLVINVCKSCWHSQLSIVVDKELLYKNYSYVSGTTKTLYLHQKATVRDILSRFNKKPRVLEIASNDGQLLRIFKDLGCDVLGIDPAENLLVLSQEKNVETLVDFFPECKEKVPGKFDVIFAANVFAHIDNNYEFLESAKELLNEDGMIIIEMPNTKEIILNGTFGQIYHEHLSYFTISSMTRLASRCSLYIKDIVATDIHGGSLRFYLSVGNESSLFLEDNRLCLLDTYLDLGKKVESIKDKFLDVYDLFSFSMPIVQFGATAKSATELNYFFNMRGFFDYCVDENPLKQELKTPGMNTLIVPMSRLELEENDLAIVISAWNFFDEIVKKVKKIRPNKRDFFIRYFPEININM